MIRVALSCSVAAAAVSITGCYELRIPSYDGRCSSSGFEKPERSLGYDREIVHLEIPKNSDEPDNRPPSKRKRQYLFEREPSGTSEALRGVCLMPERGIAIAVGDHGTVRVRHPLFGWEVEAPGTEEDLRAVVWAHLERNFAFDDVPSAAAVAPAMRDPFVAVGTHGVAAVRGRDASWRLEDTGTTKDLRAVEHFGMFTVAVGAGGTMVERSKYGVWRKVDTHTTADLASVGWLGEHVGAVGARGTIVDCERLDDKLVCAPRPSPVDADLLAVEGVIFGRGVRLAGERPNGPGPLEWHVVPEKTSFLPGDEVRAVSGDIAVGLHGLVLVLAKTQLAPTNDAHPPPLGRVMLPYGVDLHGVVFNWIQGYAVGDQGTIVHLGVHGTYHMATCEL